MRRIFGNRRGVALESAILFMLVTFALSLLILGAVTMMHYRNRADVRSLTARMELEQIGTYFVTEDTRLEAALEDSPYEPTVENGGNTLTLRTRQGKTVLYIEKDGEGHVSAWRYSAPTEE